MYIKINIKLSIRIKRTYIYENMISLGWRQAWRPQACGPQLGSALQVMLALRRSFREVIVTYEVLMECLRASIWLASLLENDNVSCTKRETRCRSVLLKRSM